MRKRMVQKIFTTSLVLFLLACQKEETSIVAPVLNAVPQGFPAPNIPSDNAFTEARFQLGKRLFYDPILSRDSSISCASCHNQQLGFTDGLAFSEGIEKRKGTRNASALFNLAYSPNFLREGGVPTLEMQILVPISEHAEMDFNILKVAEKLNKDSNIVKQSLACYGRNPDPYVITRAIGNFERTLLSGNSSYDKYTFQNDNKALTQHEILGKNLFFSEKLACAKCHESFNFTNYAFENNGLYENYNDTGRFRLTGEEADRALFKVPTLRNIAQTAPYMHDGSFKTLEQIVEHYNSGGKNHVHKSKLIKPLNLTNQEKQDLVAFLKSLTDDAFLNNKNFQQ
jgi:cytochrome c peroxidase